MHKEYNEPPLLQLTPLLISEQFFMAPSLCKLILSFWVCVTRYALSAQNKYAYLLCNISRKAWGMKLIFYLQINTSFLQVDSITLGVCSQLSQSTQNNKFTISLQYGKENVKDEVNFLPADKR